MGSLCSANRPWFRSVLKSVIFGSFFWVARELIPPPQQDGWRWRPLLASAVKVKMGLWGARSIPHPGGLGSVGAPRAQAAPSATCGWLCHVPMLLRGSWPTRVRVRGTMSTEMTPRGVDSASTLSEALFSVCSGTYQCGAYMGTLLGHLGGHVGCVGGFVLAGAAFVPIRFHQATWPRCEKEG